MLRIGQVMNSLSKKGVVYVEDVHEDRAVRIVRAEIGIDAFIKLKGKQEVRSRYDKDMVQDTFHELHNRENNI